MMKTISTVLIALLCLFIFEACSGNGSANNSDQSPTKEETGTDETSATGEGSGLQEEAPAPFEAKDLLYTWVDKLNIRENPDGKVVASVDSDQAVEVIGEKSKERSIYVLRGVAYVDHWYKVKTQAGEEGWVFGGAVKRENEKKGNAPISEESFDFPHFGQFDLSSWKNLGKTYPEEEEIDIEVTTYQKNDRILEITKSDRGEFYYGYTYKLMDGNKKLLKRRDFGFSSDVDYGGITETVKDYTTSPTKVYSRSQTLDKNVHNLNSPPVMAYGPWEEGIDESKLEASAEEINALYRAVESGKDIKLKNLAYYLDRPLMIQSQEGFTLDGNGAELIMRDRNADVVGVYSSNGITLKNFKATHVEPDGLLGCTGSVVLVNNSSDVRIEKCELNGSGIIGVMAYDSKNLIVSDNHIYNNSEYGVLFDGNTSIEIKGNQFEQNGESGNAHVFKALNASLSEVESIAAAANTEGVKMSGNTFD